MKYITGVHALNYPCSLETCGDWHSEVWLNTKNIWYAESDESVFKTWGIENTKKGPIANHLRAILDIMEWHDLRWLKGFKEDFICTEKYDKEFFEKVIQLKGNKNWDNIEKLMKEEYKIKWIKYLEEKDNE